MEQFEPYDFLITPPLKLRYPPLTQFEHNNFANMVAHKGHPLTLEFQTFSMNFTRNQVSLLRFHPAHMPDFHIVYSELTE